MASWEGGTRGRELRDLGPGVWEALRRQVIARAGGRCELVDERGMRCHRPGRDVDHRVHRDDHRVESLQLLCVSHHKIKTSQESYAAKLASKARGRRAPERHPGLL